MNVRVFDNKNHDIKLEDVSYSLTLHYNDSTLDNKTHTKAVTAQVVSITRLNSEGDFRHTLQTFLALQSWPPGGDGRNRGGPGGRRFNTSGAPVGLW